MRSLVRLMFIVAFKREPTRHEIDERMSIVRDYSKAESP